MLIGSIKGIVVVAGMASIQVVLAAPAAGQTLPNQPWRIALPNGEYINVLIERPSNRATRAVLILLPGGDGRLKLDLSGRITRMRNNFLVRTRGEFHREGYVTALHRRPRPRGP